MGIYRSKRNRNYGRGIDFAPVVFDIPLLKIRTDNALRLQKIKNEDPFSLSYGGY